MSQMVTERRPRIVVYRLGSLGDTVVALPALHAIARAFPDAERVMLTNSPVSGKAAPLEAILDGSGLFHKFVEYPIGIRSLPVLRALRRSLLSLDSTTLVYLTPPRGLFVAWRDLIFFRICGFKRILGIPLTRDSQLNRRGSDGSVERECERIARSVAALGPIDLTNSESWDLHLTADEVKHAAALLEPVCHSRRIVINMGGKVLENDWGVQNWSSLIGQLREEFGRTALVFVGSREDEPRAGKMADLWPGPTLNLCGVTSPRVTAAVMIGAAAFAGHDSGPLHLAASVGVPCVGIFGSHNQPRKWHPVGPQHRILHDMRGVLAIPVEQVRASVEDVLRDGEFGAASKTGGAAT